MRTFIKGQFLLAKNVDDLAAYEERHKSVICELLDYAEGKGLEFNLGTSDDNSYFIEYRIIGKNYTYCKGVLSGMKSILREGWGKIENLLQISGDYIG